MLRKHKRRYLGIMRFSENGSLEALLMMRHIELFGAIGVSAASMKVIEENGKFAIIRCSLPSVEELLVTIALLNPPMVTLAISGSLRKLNARLKAIDEFSVTAKL